MIRKGKDCQCKICVEIKQVTVTHLRSYTEEKGNRCCNKCLVNTYKAYSELGIFPRFLIQWLIQILQICSCAINSVSNFALWWVFCLDLLHR